MEAMRAIGALSAALDVLASTHALSDPFATPCNHSTSEAIQMIERYCLEVELHRQHPGVIQGVMGVDVGARSRASRKALTATASKLGYGRDFVITARRGLSSNLRRSGRV